MSTLTVLKSESRLCYRLSLSLGLSDVSSYIRDGMACSSQCLVSGEREGSFLVWETVKQIWVVNIPSEKENQDT